MPTTAEPDITLASTTETQAELDHATSDNWREHFDPEKKPAVGGNGQADKSGESNLPDSKTGAASDAATAGKEGQKSDDDEPLPKGVQKRFDRLTARLKDAEDALDQERRARRSAEPGKSAAEAKPVVAANRDPEPQLKDFPPEKGGWEAWNQAHTRWAVRDENRKLAANDAAEAQQAESKAIYDAHLGRLEAARTAHDDFDDVVKATKLEFSSPQANLAFQVALVECDNSAELMYHLCTHPDELAKFQDLSPAKVSMLVGRLSEKLNPSASAAQAPPNKAKSQTPKPTTPVRGSTTAPKTDLTDPELVKDTDAWLRQRNAQLSKSRPH